MNGFPAKLGTLVYALREGRVLVHQRVTQPNIGRWTAPGGKIEPGESPAECAIREMREETGLVVADPLLRGVMTEVSPRPDYQWLSFIFVVTRFDGELAPAPGMGELRWASVADVFALPIPATDAIFLARVVRLDDPPFLLKFIYDEELRIVRMDEA